MTTAGLGRHLKRLASLTIWLVLAACAEVSGQQLGASRSLLVTVTDRTGAPTVDVSADDFVVEEGRDERDILGARVADYPVIVLIDNGAALRVMRDAVVRFITRIGQRPVAIGTLADPPTFVARLDDEREHVLERLAAITIAQSDVLRPLSALSDAAGLLAEAQPPFAVVVVLSSRPVDAADQPTTERVTPILESGAAVHVVALQAPDLTVTNERAGSTSPDLLQTLAAQTRGQYVAIYTPVSFSIALDRLADRLSTEVIVEYLVPPDSSGADARVGIRIPGARVTGLGISK